MSTGHSRASEKERKRRARQNESEEQRCKCLASLRKCAKDRLTAESTEQRYLVTATFYCAFLSCIDFNVLHAQDSYIAT